MEGKISEYVDEVEIALDFDGKTYRADCTMCNYACVGFIERVVRDRLISHMNDEHTRGKRAH